MELWMELQWQLRWQLRPRFGTEPKQPNPSRIQAQPVQKPAPEKVPNVAVWRPQERWRKANANAWHHQTGSFESMKKPCKNHVVDGAVDGAAMAASVAGLRSARSRNSQAPAGFKPNLSKNQPPKKCLTSPSDARKKDEARPTPMPDIARQAASKAWKNHAKTM